MKEASSGDSRYKAKYPLERRKQDYLRLRERYKDLPSFILAKVEPSNVSKLFKDCKTITLLLGENMKIADVQVEVKKKLGEMYKIEMKSTMSLSIFCRGRTLQPNVLLSSLYDGLKD